MKDKFAFWNTNMIYQSQIWCFVNANMFFLPSHKLILKQTQICISKHKFVFVWVIHHFSHQKQIKNTNLFSKTQFFFCHTHPGGRNKKGCKNTNLFSKTQICLWKHKFGFLSHIPRGSKRNFVKTQICFWKHKFVFWFWITPGLLVIAVINKIPMERERGEETRERARGGGRGKRGRGGKERENI